MKLKESQVSFIAEELRAKGIAYDPLHEELTDHICEEVEQLMAEGKPFMDAYLSVVRRFEKRGFQELNKEATTILSISTLLKNFLTTMLRIFRRNVGSGLIRVVGLGIGIAIFLLSFIYQKHETSFDGFHEHADQIYRMGRQLESGPVAVTAFPLVPALREDYVDYQFTRFFKDRSNSLFRLGDRAFYEDKMIWADAWFLQFFDFKGFEGDPKTALAEPYTVVVTHSMIDKYFETPPKLGDVIELRWNDEYHSLKITGIIPEWPENMHIDFEALVSFKTGERVFPGGITGAWNMNYCYSYVRLPAGTSQDTFRSSFESFVRKHVADKEKPTEEYLGLLQPLQDIHTQPEIRANYTKTIAPGYLRIGLAVGILVLLITAINFMTLTVAQFHQRTREMGIRKAIGANRRQVVLQLMFETLLLVITSLLIACGLVYFSVDAVNEYLLTGIDFSMIYRQNMFWIMPLFVLVMTITTGLYPAILFSKPNVMDHIVMRKKWSGLSFRKVLLTSQFLIAAILITFSAVIYTQVNFISNKATGYEKEHVIYVPHGRSIRYEPETFRAKALENPRVLNVSLSFYKPTDDMGFTIPVSLGNLDPVPLTANSIDEYFFENFEIEFVAGSGFSRETMNVEEAFILNEAAVELLDLDDPLGKVLKTEFNTGSPSEPFEQRQGVVVGVVKDVHFESLHSPIKPMIFLVKPYWYYYISIKLSAEDLRGSIDHLERSWAELFPGEPFEYAFLDEEFDRLYQGESRTSKGLISIAVLAVITACFGLFGYMKFAAQQKVKEISIRKVLGADLRQVAILFSKDFFITLLIANLLSWPLAYFLSIEWLQSFAYRIDMSWVPFFLSTALLMLLAGFTVLQEMMKMMKLNPSKTLRYD